MPSQRIDDVVDEEEEQPRRGAKAVKVEKNKVKRKVSENGNADEDDDADIDPLEELGDQPLDKAQAQKIHGYAQDWDMIRKSRHVHFYGVVKDVATSLAEFAEGDKAEKVSELSYCLCVDPS